MNKIKLITIITLISFFTLISFSVNAKDCSNEVKLHKKLVCKMSGEASSDKSVTSEKTKWLKPTFADYFKKKE